MSRPTPIAPSLAACALALCGSAHATIVNIQAFSDAGSTGSGTTNSNLGVGDTAVFTNAVTLNLAAGDYTITDAAGQPGAKYDAWNFESSVGGSWTNHFWVGTYQSGPASGADYTIVVDGQNGGGPGHFGGFDTEADAAAAFATAAPITLHLTQATTVGFTAPDYYLPDNQGGISLSVASVPAVPEPANVVLLLAGAALLAGVAQRRSARR